MQITELDAELGRRRRRPFVTTLIVLAAALLAAVALGGAHAYKPTGVVRRPGYCVASGLCDTGNYGRPTPCFNNTPAFEPRGYNVSSLLPALAGSKVCCTKEQFEAVARGMAQSAPIFSPCPACFHNFKQLWGYYECSPDQSTFLEVLNVVQAKSSTKSPAYINHTHYSVSGAYGWAAFGSCENVQAGSTGGSIMKLFGSPMTPQAWFQYMGNAPFPSPYQIDVSVLGGAGQPPVPNTMFARTVPCNTTDRLLRCAATDCPAAASPPAQRF